MVEEITFGLVINSMITTIKLLQFYKPKKNKRVKWLSLCEKQNDNIDDFFIILKFVIINIDFHALSGNDFYFLMIKKG